jgi:TRAP transporter TAXI family solute receptor
MITKVTRWAGIATVVMAVGTASSAQAELQLKRITIGTNPSGTVYYLIGSGFAKLFQEKLNVRSTAQPHAGSTVYVPLYAKGEMTLGLNNSMDSGSAYRGIGDHKKALKSVRALARFWAITYAYMVREDSGITSLEKLKGKKVVTHIKSVTSLTNLSKRVLATAGISEKDVTPMESGGLVRNIDLVVEGRADASPIGYAMPAFRKAHATVPKGQRILPLGPKGTDEFLDSGVPGSRTHMAKASDKRTYLKGDTQVAIFDAYLNAGSAVSNEDAYILVKTLHENWKQLQKDYGPLRGIPQNGLAPASNPHPFHDGAIKYYKEVGLWTAENDKRQAAVK